MTKKTSRKRGTKKPAAAPTPDPASRSGSLWQSLVAPIRRNPRASAAVAGTIATLAGAALFNRARAAPAGADAPPLGRLAGIDGVPDGNAARGEDIVPPSAEATF